MSGNILFLGNKIFEIPPFFQARPGDLGKKVHACSLRFSALKAGLGWTRQRLSYRVTSVSPIAYEAVYEANGIFARRQAGGHFVLFPPLACISIKQTVFLRSKAFCLEGIIVQTKQEEETLL